MEYGGSEFIFVGVEEALPFPRSLSGIDEVLQEEPSVVPLGREGGLEGGRDDDNDLGDGVGSGVDLFLSVRVDDEPDFDNDGYDP